MSIMKIDWLEPSQHDSFVTLLCELYNFYYRSEQADPAAMKIHLQEKMLADAASTKFLVAVEDTGEIVGFAALGLFYSLIDPRPDHSHQCLMKELYVRDSHRDEGTGLALMAWAADWALQQGCARMDWNVDSSNVSGRRFYEHLGGRIVEDRVSYRIQKRQMTALAGQKTTD